MQPGYSPYSSNPRPAPATGYPPQATPGYPPSGYTASQPGVSPYTASQPGGYPSTGSYPGTATGGYAPQGVNSNPYASQTGYPGGAQGYPSRGANPTGYPGGTPSGYPPTVQPGAYGAQPPKPAAPLTGWAASYYNQVTPQEMQTCRQWFDSVDRDRSGSVSAQELALVQFNGRPLGLGVAQKLIKVFDKDHSGSIDFNEYVALHKFLMTMQTAFFAADQDRSGLIDAREIHTALQQARFSLSLQTVQAITKKFDQTGRGIDFPTFLFVTAHLAHIRSIFEWNDTRNLGTVSLNFDAFCHIGTDLLP